MSPAELARRLASPDARERDRALDELSDRLEYGEPDAAEVASSLAAVSDLVAREDDALVLESALHALATAAATGAGRAVPVTPVLARLGRLEQDRQLLEYVLIVLGASGDSTNAEIVRRYVSHPEPSVREEARRALEELSR